MNRTTMLDAVHSLLVQARSLVSRLWGGTTLGVRALVIEDGRILLVRHTYVSGWHMPGGGVNAGETVEAAARRELLEETGYEAIGPAHFIGLYFNPAVAGRDHVALYQVSGFVMRRAFKANHEIAEINFFPLDQLPETTTKATRQRLAELSEGLPPAEYW